MTDHRETPISEDELHAFRDGLLPAEREKTITALLASHPDLAGTVESWRRNEAALGALLGQYRFGDASDLPVISHGRAGPVSRRAAIAAAIMLAFGLGGGAGYVLRGASVPPTSSVADAEWLDTAARDVFLTYVREVRHPVEVGAEEREHLTSWLGNRIERPFTAPSLAELGFGLVGGRLLPINGRPGAMLMYENAAGDRATILLARNSGARDTAFQYSQGEGVNTFRWIDGPLAYAISGFLERPALEDISRAVYDHFEAI